MAGAHRSVTFFVEGLPIPKGSVKAFYVKKINRAVVVNDNARTKPWASAISIEASQAGCDPQFTGPVRIEASFFFPRPKGHFGAKGLKASAPLAKTQKPDLDKLVRTLLDALTGVAFVDDSQVIELLVLKLWVRAGGVPGAEVSIEDASQPQRSGQGATQAVGIGFGGMAESAHATEARGNAGGHS